MIASASDLQYIDHTLAEVERNRELGRGTESWVEEQRAG